MSFDVFVQTFRNGDAAETNATIVRAILSPLIRGNDIGVLHCTDGTTDLYGWDALEEGFMINHVEGMEIWDVLVQVAREAGMTIMPVGCPVAVTSAAAISDLPEPLRDDVVIVQTGQDLLAAIRGNPAAESGH